MAEKMFQLTLTQSQLDRLQEILKATGERDLNGVVETQRYRLHPNNYGEGLKK